MRVYELLDSPKLVISNEEHHFAENHPSNIELSSLTERDLVIAQNLVRKGLYSISKDSTKIIRQGHEVNQKSALS
jgi:hypothetical protein